MWKYVCSHMNFNLGYIYIYIHTHTHTHTHTYILVFCLQFCVFLSHSVSFRSWAFISFLDLLSLSISIFIQSVKWYFDLQCIQGMCATGSRSMILWWKCRWLDALRIWLCVARSAVRNVIFFFLFFFQTSVSQFTWSPCVGVCQPPWHDTYSQGWPNHGVCREAQRLRLWLPAWIWSESSLWPNYCFFVVHLYAE